MKHPIWTGLIGFFLFIIIISLFLSDENNTSQTTQDKYLTQNKVIEDFNIFVTNQIVKKVGSKCRYFFDIRNQDNKDFEGSVKIRLINKKGGSVWDETFSTNRAIEPNLGTSVYTDAYTCPVAVHGDYGIATYNYEVKVDNEVVKTGSGTISNEFEDLS